MILSTIQQKHLPPKKQKKRKVASGAEVVKSANMVELLKEKDDKSANKKARQSENERKPGKAKKGKAKKKIEDLEEDSTDAGSDDEVQYANSDESDWIEEEVEEVTEEPGDEIVPNDKENMTENQTENVSINKWVIVKYTLTKGIKHYVGFVQKKIQSRWEVKFVRCKGASFVWPTVEDVDVVTNDSIVKILPNPEMTKRGIINFDFKFRNMIIS